VATPLGQPLGPASPLWRAGEQLCSDELKQLWRYAAWRLKALGPRAAGLAPDDLLQESMVRLAEGVRNLPAQLKLKDALIGVMRSVANAWGQLSLHNECTGMLTDADASSVL
jgi:DNA-directed RNA polymerase specialized sigma24 family protein